MDGRYFSFISPISCYVKNINKSRLFHKLLTCHKLLVIFVETLHHWLHYNNTASLRVQVNHNIARGPKVRVRRCDFRALAAMQC